jgi:hypothetical protein
VSGLSLLAPDRHAPAEGPPLTDAGARAAVERLTADLLAAARRWQIRRPDLELGLYDGAAGGLWLMSKLAAADLGTRRALADDLLDALAQQGAPPATPGSFLVGDVGVFFAAAELGAPDADGQLLDALLRCGGDGPNEVLFGPPGRALAAAARYAATGEEAFVAAWRQAMAGVLAAEVRLDEQRFATSVGHYLGAAHGVAGVLSAVLGGGGWVTEDERDRILDEGERALHVEALRITLPHGGGRTNWPPQPGVPPLVQWCHGAPGVLLALAGLPVGERPALDASLVEGAWLTAEAGGVRKGAGFCHGTSGNALGVLAIARRLPPAKAPLARRLEAEARRLMAHALGQLDAARGRHGEALGWALNLYEGPPGVLYGLLALLGEAPLTAPALSGRQPWPVLGGGGACTSG